MLDMPKPSEISVYAIVDENIVGEQIKDYLAEVGYDFLGYATSSEEGIRQYETYATKIAVIDGRMVDQDRSGIVRRLIDIYPLVSIVMLIIPSIESIQMQEAERLGISYFTSLRKKDFLREIDNCAMFLLTNDLERSDVSVCAIVDKSILGEQVKDYLTDVGYDFLGYAISGEEGIEYYKTHRPDFVLIDINFKDMDGISLARQLLEINPSVSIAMMGTTQSPDLIKLAIEVGIYDLVDKPLGREWLIRVIDNWARSRNR